jgi:hypothetical protein
MEMFRDRTGDLDLHGPAIVPGPIDESADDKAVQQPRHVRIAGPHAFADLAAAEARRPGAAQDPEYVVTDRPLAKRL